MRNVTASDLKKFINLKKPLVQSIRELNPYSKRYLNLQVAFAVHLKDFIDTEKIKGRNAYDEIVETTGIKKYRLNKILSGIANITLEEISIIEGVLKKKLLVL